MLEIWTPASPLTVKNIAVGNTMGKGELRLASSPGKAGSGVPICLPNDRVKTSASTATGRGNGTGWWSNAKGERNRDKRRSRRNAREAAKRSSLFLLDKAGDCTIYVTNPVHIVAPLLSSLMLPLVVLLSPHYCYFVCILASMFPSLSRLLLWKNKRQTVRQERRKGMTKKEPNQ